LARRLVEAGVDCLGTGDDVGMQHGMLIGDRVVVAANNDSAYPVAAALREAGAAVTIVGVSRMDGFESKSLGRTFDRIWFGSLASGADAPAAAVGASAALPPGHVPVGGAADSKAMAAQHAGASTAPVEGVIQVEKAAGPDGRTIAEVYAGRVALKGRSVAVRGKVVKFNSEIMGKNWIHLRDGSGSAAARDNDLTVTTDGVAHVGDVVTVSGAVSVDRDFGAGYAYPVILEGARVSK